jgi:small ligand-binding sensory domain FIST
MKYLMIAVLLLGGFVTLAATTEANAMACARGVYRAGCVGVRGAAVVRRPVVRRRVY